MILKEVTLDDIASLQKIARLTFIETFAESNTEEDLHKYVADSFNEERITNEVKNPNSLFYIAWDDLEPIGYFKVNFKGAQTELQEQDSLEIERIYVKSEYHGKKVGQLLYNKALEVAQSTDKSSIWLGVWEKNPRAIRFYEKNGFQAFDKHIFKMGDDEQTDILMRKLLG